MFYFEVCKRGTAKGHGVGESSWILEDNQLMVKGVEKMGFRLSKTYRLYEKAVAE